jgi:hypothetical protein
MLFAAAGLANTGTEKQQSTGHVLHSFDVQADINTSPAI